MAIDSREVERHFSVQLVNELAQVGARLTDAVAHGEGRALDELRAVKAHPRVGVAAQISADAASEDGVKRLIHGVAGQLRAVADVAWLEHDRESKDSIRDAAQLTGKKERML